MRAPRAVNVGPSPLPLVAALIALLAITLTIAAGAAPANAQETARASATARGGARAKARAKARARAEATARAKARARADARARAKAKAKAKARARAKAKTCKVSARARAKAKTRAKRTARAKKTCPRKRKRRPPVGPLAGPAPVAQPAAPVPNPLPGPSPAPVPGPPSQPGPPTRPPTRPPTPPVHRDGSAAGWNGYGVGSWPGANWRPYADSSPFNRRIGGTAPHPNSAALARKILSWGTPQTMVAGGSGTTSDYGHPTYWSQPTDPLFTLRATGTPNGIQNTQIPIPDAAQAARGGDGHMTVVTPDGWEYDFWQVASKPRGGGTMTFSIGGRIPIDGDGLDGKATASLFGNLAGVIRAQEMIAGEIDHALFVVLKCASAKADYGFGTVVGPSSQSAYVYPATHGGTRCSGSEDVDAPPMGARIQLAMSDAEIAALGVPAWKKTILTALAHYGGYVGDTGGSGFGLMFESGATYTSFGAADPLVDFARASGVPEQRGLFIFDVASGVDWARYLRVLTPPSP